MIFHSEEFDNDIALNFEKIKSEFGKFAYEIKRGNVVEEFKDYSKYFKQQNITLVVFKYKTYVFLKTQEEITAFVDNLLKTKNFFLSDEQIVKRLVKSLEPFAIVIYTRYTPQMEDSLAVCLLDELKIKDFNSINDMVWSNFNRIKITNGKLMFGSMGGSDIYSAPYNLYKTINKLRRTVFTLQKYNPTQTHLDKALAQIRMIEIVEK